MKTGSLVLGMTGAGVLGGVVGALLFLTLFAGEFRPEPVPPALPPPEPEPVVTPAEAAALRRLPRRIEELEGALAGLRGELDRRTARAAAGPPGATPVAPSPSGEEGREARARNERAAVATLRNLCSAQAQVQTSGRIDADRDGIGEFGSLQEMAGMAGVRASSRGRVTDFSDRGNTVSPAVLGPAMAALDGDGRVQRNGYLFQVFLPDGGSPAGWTHETGPAGSPTLAGGTGTISVDLSETTWCSYAWPAKIGESGDRVFFTNQAGDVLSSANEIARHEGTAPFDPSSAFRGQSITSPLAIGTRGNDGDVWRVAN